VEKKIGINNDLINECIHISDTSCIVIAKKYHIFFTFSTDIKSYHEIRVIHKPRRISRSLPKETSEIFAAGEVTFNTGIAHRDDH